MLDTRLSRDEVSLEEINRAAEESASALRALQRSDGYWVFDLEADVTISAEFILYLHYLDESDPDLERKIATYIRAKQAEHGGWPLFHGGDVDVSATVKAYFALKAVGDDPAAPHMVRARETILAHGGAAQANVFTRILLALFGQVPWRAVPVMPVEIMLLPRWFFFHLSKVSYWSRTVIVPLLVLTALRPRARNPRGIDIGELFIVAPHAVKRWNRAPAGSVWGHVFLGLDWLLRMIEPRFPREARRRAIGSAVAWVDERLNGEDGLGAIFPAMVNAVQMYDAVGTPVDDPRVVIAKRSIRKLVVDEGERAWVQPCVSPVWDTALAMHAVLESGDDDSLEAARRAAEWLATCQITDVVGDWAVRRPGVPPGGWAFQYANPHYPDVDDSAVVIAALDRLDRARYAKTNQLGAAWLRGMQSSDGGWGAFEPENTHNTLNYIPFADHGALLDPPTADVSARCVSALAVLAGVPRHGTGQGDGAGGLSTGEGRGLALFARLTRPWGRRAAAVGAGVDVATSAERAANVKAVERGVRYLLDQQESDGSWFGRWGTNYIYGTWSALAALNAAGITPESAAVRRAVAWLVDKQRADGGWGEDGRSYWAGQPRGVATDSTPSQTAWALLGLMAAGQGGSDSVRRGIDYLVKSRREDGLWGEDLYTAVGFPRIFYLRYDGYRAYFPVWALARYCRLAETGFPPVPHAL